MPLPAHCTKHISLLDHTDFVLEQRADGVSNGTALWLAGQVLAFYLQEHHCTRPGRAIELGSGTGLTALTLAAHGWNVIATDIDHVVTSVLQPNIARNAVSGTVRVCQLDWTIPPPWDFDHPSVISTAPKSPVACPTLDLIVTADTVYSRELVEPLLRTLHTLCVDQEKQPIVYLCIERRDPALVDHLLQEADTRWNFTISRIPHKKLARAVEKHAKGWTRDDWQDVHLWKFVLRR